MNSDSGTIADFQTASNFNPSFFDPTHRVRLGSSGATFSTSEDYSSWDGDILMAAMYQTALTSTQIDDLYAEGLPNSRPVAPVSAIANVVEDNFTAVDVSASFYDFDVPTFGAPALTYSLVGGVTTGPSPSPSVVSPGGRFRINGAVTDVNLTSSLPATYTSLTYRANENEYTRPGVVGVFPVRASDSFTTSSNLPVTVNIAPVNDVPVARNYTTPTSTSQSTSARLLFTGFDVDCRTTPTDSAASCALGDSKLFTITDLPAPGVSFGKLYRPDIMGNCTGYTLAEEVTVGNTFLLAGAGDRTLVLCFEGCLDGPSGNDCPPGTNNEATVGTHVVQFTVRDDAMAFSAPGFVSTTVTSVLSTDVNFILADLLEDQGANITIQGRDNVCVPPLTNPACTDGSRDPRFVLDSLPDPAQGVLYTNSSMVELVAVGVEVTNPVFLMPAANYFNHDSWPLCSARAAVSFSACPSFQEDTAFPCLGPLCGTAAARYSVFTTRDLAGRTMGLVQNCTQGAAGGCPISLTYRMRVGVLESLSATGMRIFIRNVQDPVTINVPFSSVDDIPRNEDVPLRSTSGAAVTLSDPDGDNRVLSLTMRLDGPPDGFLVIAGFSEAGISSSLVSGVANFGSLSGSRSFTFQGVLSELNKVLPLLQYKMTGTSVADTVRIVVYDVTRGSTGQKPPTEEIGVQYAGFEAAFPVSILPDSGDDEGGLSLPTAALYGVIGGGGLCCLGFCCCTLYAIVAAARRGNRTARWVLKNVLFTKMSGSDDERDRALQKEMSPIARATEQAVRAEHARLEEVQWCVHLLSCICPCCVRFNPDKDMVPDEEKILVAVNDSLKSRAAAAHVPRDKREKSVRLVVTPNEIFDWEKHEYVDEKTGATHAYYYNAKTGQSSWLQPTVRRSVNTPTKF